MNWHSGFDLIAHDEYATPQWVSEIVLPYIRHVGCVWEPAAGAGQMATVLKAAGHWVCESDIQTGTDFLAQEHTPLASVRAIVTNPPYRRDIAQRFVCHALDLMMPCGGIVAMLLPETWDMAQMRAPLFSNPAWRGKIAIRKRIRWFEGTKGSPRGHHCWMLWDWRCLGAMPTRYWPDPSQWAA